jgi:TolB-like protein/Tfp pilus assembly protein PilF/predicted Ser/Thr protein kinase
MISKKCPKCEFENPEKARFCNECGAKLIAEEGPPAAQPEPAQGPSQTVPSESAPPEPVHGSSETSPDVSAAKPSILLAAPARPEPILIPAGASVQPEVPLEPRQAVELGPEQSGPPQTPETPPVLAPEPEAPVPTSGGFSADEEEVSFDEFPLEGPSPQQPFGARFKLIEELGTGTLGTVYKVFDKAMERDQALKAVKPEISQKAEAFEGFARELKIERGLVHKNIARIFELNVLKGTPFITMEYVSGRSLRSLLKEKKRLSVMEAISIAKQLFAGLAYAHKAGALHLDLRPENIMIDREGTVKIMDLGIARLFRAKGIIRSVAGLPQYMSPEQLAGQEADARSDIFAAGVTLYDMLTGNLPPVGETPRAPRDLNPAVPPQVSLLVLRCIEQEKERRYQTAEEIRAELEVIETIAGQAPAEAPVEHPAEKPVEMKPAAEPATVAGAEPKGAPASARTHKKERMWRGLRIPSRALFPALAALALVILAVLLWRFVFRPSKGGPALPAQPPQLTLAVLPLEDLSPAKDKQHLGTVLAENLIRSLARLGNLSIPAIESASTFQGKAHDSRLIGRRLGVDYYLEGTFEEQNDKLKVNARLVQADSGTPLWSGQYERSASEVAFLQEEIARAAGKSLGLRVPTESDFAPRPGSSVNFDALDIYAQARSLISQKGRDKLEKAIDLFAEAGAKDASFALSFAGLADGYIQLAQERYGTPDKAIPRAKEAALKALLLDSGLSEGHTALARIKMIYEWDFGEAEKEFQEALRLDSNQAATHQFYALLLSASGRHRQAVKESQLAQALNPLSSAVNAQAGTILFYARLYEQAEAEVKKAVATDPLYPGHHLNAALIQAQMGNFEQAAGSLEEGEELGADPMEVKLRMAYLHARQGRRQEAGRLLTEAFNAPKQFYVSQVSVALVYAGLNEKDQAIASLENAYAERDGSLIFMGVHPFLDPVRGDSRFVSLLLKFGRPT